MQLSPWLRGRLWRARHWGICALELAAEVQNEPPSFEMAARTFELAQVLEAIVPNRERAVELYIAAWKADRSNRRALARARFLCRELGNLATMAKIAELEFRQTGDIEYQIAQGYAWLDAGQPDRAIMPLAAACKARPADAALVNALAAARREWPNVREELARLEQGAVDTPDREHSGQCYLQAARILRLLQTEPGAYRQMLDRAFERNPRDDSSYVLLEQLLEEAGDWEGLVTIYGHRAEASVSDYELVEVYRRGGMALSLRGYQPAFGARLLLKALQIAYERHLPEIPGHLAMYAMLRDHFGRAQSLAPMLALIRDAESSSVSTDEQVYFSSLGVDVGWCSLRDAMAAYPHAVRLQHLVADHCLLADYIDEGGYETAHQAAQRDEAAVAVVQPPEQSVPAPNRGSASTVPAPVAHSAAATDSTADSLEPDPREVSERVLAGVVEQRSEQLARERAENQSDRMPRRPWPPPPPPPRPPPPPQPQLVIDPEPEPEPEVEVDLPAVIAPEPEVEVDLPAVIAPEPEVEADLPAVIDPEPEVEVDLPAVIDPEPEPELVLPPPLAPAASRRLSLAERALQRAEQRRQQAVDQRVADCGEQRVSPRIPVHADAVIQFHAEITLQLGGRQLAAVTRDISADGAFIALEEPIAVGTSLVLQLDMPGEDDWALTTYKLDAVVARMEVGVGVGVRFSEPPAEYLADVEALRRTAKVD